MDLCKKAIRELDYKIEFVSIHNIIQREHCMVAKAFLEAYGNDERGFVFTEARSKYRNERPIDILLCHKDVGVVVIEVKAWDIKSIIRLVNNCAEVNFSPEVIPFIDEAEKAMFSLKNDMQKVIRKNSQQSKDLQKTKLPLFNFFIAFPNISIEDWKTRRFEECTNINQVLFSGDLSNPLLLKRKVNRFIHENPQRKGSPLTEEQLRYLRLTVGDSSCVIPIQKQFKSRKKQGSENKQDSDESHQSSDIETAKQEALLARQKLELAEQEKNKLLSALTQLQQGDESLKKEIENYKRIQQSQSILEKKVASEKQDREKLEHTISSLMEKQNKLENQIKSLSIAYEQEAQKEAQRKELYEDLERKYNNLSIKYQTVIANKQDIVPQSKEKEIENNKLSIREEIDNLIFQEKPLTLDQLRILDQHLSDNQYLVRGVAGSGKTLLLANNLAKRIAKAHSEYEGSLKFEGPKRFGVVCYNRCLVPFIKESIKEYLALQLPSSVSVDKVLDSYLSCAHLAGFMFMLSNSPQNPKPGPLPYVHVNNNGEFLGEVWHKNLLSLKAKNPEEYDSILFDAIYVDEGQDLNPQEYLLLKDLLKTSPITQQSNLVIFYDDAQNLYGRTRPVWGKLGINVNSRSFVLKESKWKPKPKLNFSFNVLLGRSLPPSKRPSLKGFADFSYLSAEGMIEETGDYLSVHFGAQTGKNPVVRSFKKRGDEKSWLMKALSYLLEEGQLQPEDILILASRSKEYEDLVGEISKSKNVDGVVCPYQSKEKDNYILQRGKITFSTIESAKGYDAPIVFLLGADLLPTDNRGRAEFYVGATRSRYKLFVSGVEKDQPNLLSEGLKTMEWLKTTSKEEAEKTDINTSTFKNSSIPEPQYLVLAFIRDFQGTKKAKCRYSFLQLFRGTLNTKTTYNISVSQFNSILQILQTNGYFSVNQEGICSLTHKGQMLLDTHKIKIVTEYYSTK